MANISGIKRTASRIKKVNNIRQHEALDLAAQQAGFSNWQHALRQLPEGTDGPARDPYRVALDAVLQQNPDLSDYGLASSRAMSYFLGTTSDQADETFARSRQSLADNLTAFRVVSEWLGKNVEPIKTPNRASTSYGLKHLVEAEVGYITNGVFIAAALSRGYSMTRDASSPNPSFNMSKRSIRQAADRIDAMRRNGYKRPSSPGERSEAVEAA